MKVLHIASHKGNIGDKLNHDEFYQHILTHIGSGENDIYKVEIRDFYNNSKKRKAFDTDMAEYINKFDLVIIGGGGFFDVQWDYSVTGTTIDISEEFIDMVNTKVLINAMGYHEYPGVTTNEMCTKFERLIGKLSKKSNWLVTFRNDGSFSRFRKRYIKVENYRISVVPDNALYRQEKKLSNFDSDIVGMCITNDLFSAEYNMGITIDAFNEYMGKVISNLCEEGYRVKLIPHTPDDIRIISQLFKFIDGYYLRNCISVAQMDCSSDNATERVIVEYLECFCLIGMRFHSIITGINCLVPTLALAGHEQLKGLYEELGLHDFVIKVDNLEFFEKINEFVSRSKNQHESFELLYEGIKENIKLQKQSYIEKIKKFMNGSMD